MLEVKGDLISMAEAGDFDVIIHGCNCFCTMGSGIALQIKECFPQAFDSDKRTIKGCKKKLGSYSFAKGMNNLGQNFTIINAYTQHGYGPKYSKFGYDLAYKQYKYGLEKRHTDYEAVRSVFKFIKQDFGGLRIAYPLIGAFRGGGDWEIISQIIDEELDGEHHTLVRFKKCL